MWTLILAHMYSIHSDLSLITGVIACVGTSVNSKIIDHDAMHKEKHSDIQDIYGR
jgi:hypothetical protein